MVPTPYTTILLLQGLSWRSTKNCQSVVFGDSEQKLVVGKGHFCLIMTNDHDIQITYVYYVPRLAKHLLSM